MFNEVSYLGAAYSPTPRTIPGLVPTTSPATPSGPTWQSLGFGSKQAWKQAGRPTTGPILDGGPLGAPGGGAGSTPVGAPSQVLCPDGVTLVSSLSLCPATTGGQTATGGSGGGGLMDLFSSIPGPVLLIGAAVIVLMLLKK